MYIIMSLHWTSGARYGFSVHLEASIAYGSLPKPAANNLCAYRSLEPTD